VVSATKCLDGGRHSWDTIYIETHWDSIIKYCWCTKCGSRTEFSKKKDDIRAKWRRCVDWDEGVTIEIPRLLLAGSRKSKRLNMRKHMLETDVDEPLGAKI